VILGIVILAPDGIAGGLRRLQRRLRPRGGRARHDRAAGGLAPLQGLWRRSRGRGRVLSLAGGELLALIGPNGAGKTTCFNMLNGQIRADSGSVKLDGAELLGRKPAPDLAHGRGPDLPDHRDLRLDDGGRERADGADFAARETFGTCLPRRASATATRPRRCSTCVGMADQAERACAELAYGDLKRLELAVALAHGPRLLLMDEPTAGMAPSRACSLMALAAGIVASRASRSCSPSTTWTSCSPTPTASWCSTAAA
jgi:hypothetical protein